VRRPRLYVVTALLLALVTLAGGCTQAGIAAPNAATPAVHVAPSIEGAPTSRTASSTSTPTAATSSSAASAASSSVQVTAAAATDKGTVTTHKQSTSTGLLASMGRPFPASNAWNTPITGMGVDPLSSAIIASIGTSTKLHMDFGANWNGGPFGIPYIVVPSTQAMVKVTFDYAGESDPGPYPIPANAPIEGGAASTGDRHVIVVQPSTGKLYELYAAYPNTDGSWRAGSGAIFNLTTGADRPAGWTSADAAGLPILPGLVRYDEVASGVINHAIRFTVATTRKAYVYPARHYASSNTSTSVPPMGTRVRLRADFDISGYPQQARVILQAMKTYGMIVADNGSNWYVSGTADPRWNDDQLNTLKNVPGSAFDVVTLGTVATG
jgi:hypothetical protein